MSVKKNATEQGAPEKSEQSIDVSALKAELMAELRAEMATEQGAPEKKTAAPKKNDYLEEYVEIQLFKDGQKYKDDVYVSVNGENCVIKRGVPVKIKRKFALVIEQSMKQDVAAAEYAEARQNEYKDGLKQYGIG